MELNDKMSIFVLSCDKYEDVWDNFFAIKDKFWPDCNFKWYLVTESKQYHRKDVTTINASGNWSTRYRKAVEFVDTPYICSFLDDYFIVSPVDNQRINNLVDFLTIHKVSYLNLDDGFNHIQKTPNLQHFSEDIVVIPAHMKYGVDTAGAIWDRNYLLEKLGNGDYSAWQFELDRCIEADSEAGLNGTLLLDQKQSLNISKIPVIIQGAYYPPALEDFKKRGVIIDVKDRTVMSSWDVFVYWLKRRCAKAKHGRKFLKWVGTNVFNIQFVSKN